MEDTDRKHGPADPSSPMGSTGPFPLSSPDLPSAERAPSRPNGAARHSKRLTLNFPINLPPTPSDPSSSSPGSMTPVHSSARQSPSLPPVSDEQDDSNNLLTAIASQERKVLEVREELQNAESVLASLKKQWTLSEKTRKRTEISHNAEPLLPLRSPDQPSAPAATVAAAEDPQSHRRNRSVATPDPSSTARLSRDLDRRQSMRAAAAAGSTVSANGRRVFHGSHTRTLSLLSAASDSTYRKPGSPSDPDQPRPEDRISRVPRAATLPSVERTEPFLRPGPNPTDEMIPWRGAVPPPSREALMRTGKQMASDLREGLWTFLEDIRQATVGEEGINGTQSRGMSPHASRKRDSSSTSRRENRLSVHSGSGSNGGDAGGSGGRPKSRSPNRPSGNHQQTKAGSIAASFWNEFGIDTPQKKPSHPHPGSRPHHPESDDNDPLDADSWSWDANTTPQPSNTNTTAHTHTHTPSSSRSTIESKQSPGTATQASSPRTSAR